MQVLDCSLSHPSIFQISFSFPLPPSMPRSPHNLKDLSLERWRRNTSSPCLFLHKRHTGNCKRPSKNHHRSFRKGSPLPSSPRSRPFSVSSESISSSDNRKDGFFVSASPRSSHLLRKTGL